MYIHSGFMYHIGGKLVGVKFGNFSQKCCIFKSGEFKFGNSVPRPKNVVTATIYSFAASWAHGIDSISIIYARLKFVDAVLNSPLIADLYIHCGLIYPLWILQCVRSQVGLLCCDILVTPL